MKSIVLFVVAGFLISLSCIAQDNSARLNYYLTASRNEQHGIYKPGTRLAIIFNNSISRQKVKGVFSGEKNGQLVIATRRGKGSQTYVPVEEIAAIRKIHPQRRIVFGIVGTALVTGGTAILNNAGNSPGSTYQAIVAIPFIGLGTYLLVVVPVSLLADKLSEKKRQNGWKFQLSEH